MKQLLAKTGFFAYISVVFLNAFIDLGHKIIVQNTVFKVYDGNTQIMLTAIVNALILLPFILFFTPAGFVSDKYPKSRVMRGAAWAALGLTLAITLCYYQGWFIAAFCMTFLLAVQSAFYSPSKYGYIKTLLGKERLGEGNGAVQAVTITAILLGTFVYSILFESRYDATLHHQERDILIAIAPLGWLLVANSLVQLVFAYRIPELETINASMRFDWGDYWRGRALRQNIQPIRQQPVIRLAIIGLAMFWSVSQVMLATFPAFAKETLGETNTVMIQGTLAASGLGIMLGALLAGRWSKNHIEMALVPLGAVGIIVGLALIPGIESNIGHIINFMMIGTMGGFFIVPLNALIQFHAGDNELGKVLAGNNLFQNIGMLTFLLITVALSSAGASAVLILSLLVLVAIFGSLYTLIRLPQSLARFFLMARRGKNPRVRVQGIRNLPEAGGALLVGHGCGDDDWALLQMASPRPLKLVIQREYYPSKYLAWWFSFCRALAVGPGPLEPSSVADIVKLLDNKQVVYKQSNSGSSPDNKRDGGGARLQAEVQQICAGAAKDVLIIPYSIQRYGGHHAYVVAFGHTEPTTIPWELLQQKLQSLASAARREYDKGGSNAGQCFPNS
jgi:acyl-[acyl-carrier-protein]-phospholipid O-acyltransferase/long-chain-fatty-acid--[acyl-carrier-protein] ligase